MFNPDTAPVSVYMPSFEMAARSLKVVPITAPVHDDEEIETAIIGLGREPGGGVVVASDVFAIAHQGLASARKVSRASRPRSLRVPPETLRLVTWHRMSFSKPYAER